MSQTRDDAEQRIYESYHWPGPTVLRNRPGIRDEDLLAEAEATSFAFQVRTRPHFKAFDLVEMQQVQQCRAPQALMGNSVIAYAELPLGYVV